MKISSSEEAPSQKDFLKLAKEGYRKPLEFHHILQEAASDHAKDLAENKLSGHLGSN